MDRICLSVTFSLVCLFQRCPGCFFWTVHSEVKTKNNNSQSGPCVQSETLNVSGILPAMNLKATRHALAGRTGPRLRKSKRVPTRNKEHKPRSCGQTHKIGARNTSGAPTSCEYIGNFYSVSWIYKDWIGAWTPTLQRKLDLTWPHDAVMTLESAKTLRT